MQNKFGKTSWCTSLWEAGWRSNFLQRQSQCRLLPYDLVLYDSNVEWIEEKQWENEREMDVKAPEIVLGVNPIAQERGYPEAYRTGGVIRGLLLRCRFADGREETYSAAVRTDAAR